MYIVATILSIELVFAVIISQDLSV